jgi:hypothetical protein
MVGEKQKACQRKEDDGGGKPTVIIGIWTSAVEIRREI